MEFDSNNLYRIEDNRYKIYSSKDGITNKLFKKHNIYCIIHAATVYGRNNETDNEILFGNLYIPQLLLQKAIVNNCKIFINTDSVLDRFTSSYSLTKTHFLEWLKFYSKKNAIRMINLRLEHFYGPGASESNFISSMIVKMLKNDPNIDLTMGEQNRDFLYISDLLNVFDLIINNIDNLKFFKTSPLVQERYKY